MNYDPNITMSMHIVKVTLQQLEYTGYVVLTIGGNCKGSDIIKTAINLGELEDSITENQCKFNTIDKPDDSSAFTCILYDSKGIELFVCDDLDSLSNYIIGVQIIDYIESDED